MRKHTDSRLYVDANGCLTEGIELGGQLVNVHYDDVPESDITIVNGPGRDASSLTWLPGAAPSGCGGR